MEAAAVSLLRPTQQVLGISWEAILVGIALGLITVSVFLFLPWIWLGLGLELMEATQRAEVQRERLATEKPEGQDESGAPDPPVGSPSADSPVTAATISEQSIFLTVVATCAASLPSP